jgi:hypothetical protein
VRRNPRCPPGWLTGLLLGCLGIGDKERIQSPGSLPKCSAGYGEASHNLPNLGLRYPQKNLRLAAQGLIDSKSRCAPAAPRCWRDCGSYPDAARAGSIRSVPSTFFDTVPSAASLQACATIGPSSTMRWLDGMTALVLRNSRASATLRSRNYRLRISSPSCSIRSKA